MEDMAADYIEQIRSVQPHGPYALAGFSIMGLIAFEIAQQLLQLGETVELVALLDTQLDEQYLTLQDWLLHQRRRVDLELCEDPRSFRAPARRLHSFKSRPFRRQASRGLWEKTPKRSSVDVHQPKVCSVYRRANGGSFWLCGSPWPHTAQRSTQAE